MPTCASGSDTAGAAATPVPAASFDSLAGERLLKAQLGVADLAAFGAFSRAELAAVGALLKYVELTQIGQKPCLAPPRRSGLGRPPAHRRGDAGEPGAAALALGRAPGQPAGGHRSHRDRAGRARAGGAAGQSAARCGGDRRPSRRGRLPARERHAARGPARTLRAAPDIARAISRLALQRGTPRDLGAVRDGLRAAGACARLLREAGGGIGLPDALARIARLPDGVRGRSRGAACRAPSSTSRRRCAATAASCAPAIAPISTRRARLREDSRKVMAALEARYVEQTGVKSLKVRHNNILGFYIEVPAGAAKPLLSRAAGADLPPSPDDGRRRALHHAGADRDRGPHRLRRRAGARHRAGGVRRAGERDCASRSEASATSPARSPSSTARRASPSSPPSRATRAPSSTTARPSRSAAGVIPWWSRR